MSLEKWQGRSAMVVDDSRTQQYEVTCLLQELGFGQIHVAQDGQDALDKLQQLERLEERIDLLLTDLNMPGMDGVELISNLEKNTHYRMFVAVMSGVERDVLDVIHAIADAGTLEVIGVLSKPLKSSDLHNMLQHCDPLIHRENKKWMQLAFTAEDVQQALDNQQLVPFLQPKVIMTDSSLYGFEALVRWLHPEHGVIPPICFVHHLEEGQLALDFFYHFLHATCDALNKLTSMPAPISCSINLPVTLLLTDKLVENMIAIVQEHQLPCNAIIIEVTETTFMSNLSMSLGTLARLRLRGFGIAMDDYGTGYSSMKQLSRCPFTEIKIDKEFVHDAHSSPKKLAILTSAIVMSQKLGLKTVAEGVESEEDWRQLALLGCELAQGYYISRPLPVEQIEKWFAEWQARVK
ncbi:MULTISPECIES: EAL domain-containing protein [Aeromonas]|jgi:EAL domain-containing protein (putative c-di-GMP-specific phosphodiesterase class I)/FixJ family two-component response regulator|uniref:EAL domain-containing protein n=1 Tax=Aeromonas piscicola TaxID=600645 RepID=A0ABT7Q7K7_9GAMM|nr:MULTISPECIES: EAL domain-containing response regulator [Aeromonas]MCW0506779.1 EAL domain-containing protein [Aeromonas piscicola]MCX7130766.1 EAL domain-containing response regulator [Aeromonas sp.]MDM5129526.1 EAL domain-containing protein [Aeromonas piscicola]